MYILKNDIVDIIKLEKYKNLIKIYKMKLISENIL